MPAFTALADTLGVSLTFEKPIKFEELGLAVGLAELVKEKFH